MPPDGARAVKAGMSPADARVLLPDAGHKMVKRDQPQLARSLGAAATTVLEAREPEAPDTEPQLGLALWELEAGMCRFAVNARCGAVTLG